MTDLGFKIIFTLVPIAVMIGCILLWATLYNRERKRIDKNNLPWDGYLRPVTPEAKQAMEEVQRPTRMDGVRGTQPNKKASVPIMEMQETGQSTQKNRKSER